MITHSHFNIRSIHQVDVFKRQLQQQFPSAGVIIQTCKRLEIYNGDGEIKESTARHLFRLICGLDSVFIGDTAVKSQVKKAYLEFSQMGCLSKNMHKLFQTALHVGKLVQSTTAISVGAVSYPQAVIHILKALSPDIRKLTVSIVGINDITNKLFKWLIQSGVSKLNMINRSPVKPEDKPGNPGIQIFLLNQLPFIIGISDVLILCTSAPGYLFTRHDVPPGKKLIIIDLSWPRNADPAIEKSADIRLFTLDDIEQSIHQNLDARKESIELAEMIIENELGILMKWQENNHLCHYA